MLGVQTSGECNSLKAVYQTSKNNYKYLTNIANTRLTKHNKNNYMMHVYCHFLLYFLCLSVIE